MEMDLKEICDGIAVIEPRPFPIWQQIMSAYPRDHFSAIIKQVAEQMSEGHDETYSKLVDMVKEGLA